uniref:Tudor domain-containing protein 5 n=1 Tax=Hippocampus comes TaxID=109280 RepID=A0A3Q2YBZ1_HIPCM
VSRGQNYSRPHKMNPDAILAKLKKDLRSLLISSKVDLDPELLRRDYKAMVGHPLPLKLLGFRNVIDMLNEIPDVSASFLSVFTAVSHESTRHMEELVAKQRTSTSDIKRKDRQFSSYRNCRQSIPRILPKRGGAPLALPPQLRAQLRRLLSQGPLKLSELETSFLRCFGHALHVHDLGFYSLGEMLEAAKDLVLIQQCRFGSMLTLREQMLPKTFDTQQNLRKLFSNDSKNVLCKNNTTVCSVHEGPTNASCNLQMIEKNQEPEPRLSQEQHFLKLQDEFCRRIAENGVAGTISHMLKDKLQKVVSQSSCGISVHHLPVEYKRLFGEDLPLKENGFVSVTELVDAMGDIFSLEHVDVDEDGKHDWIIKNIHSDDDPGVKQPQTSCHFQESLWDCEVGASDAVEERVTRDRCVKQETMSELYPAIKVYCSTVVPLDALQRQHLKRPTPRSAFELVQVKVEQVESPRLFYSRFTGNEEARTFEYMKAEMIQCYSSPDVSERYRLPKGFVRRGQVCCASSKDMQFTRGVIHKVIGPAGVEVYHVDFGTVTTVHTDDLMFLKSCFSILPAQAVPSSLAGIKPITGAWTSEAIASFVSLCRNRLLVAALVCYDGDVLQLYLCDTNTDEDIYIHSVLLSQGHGESCSPSMCVQVSPVSLYLGEGTFHLPDVEGETTESADTFKQPVRLALRFECEEMPALEFIGDSEISTHIQVRRNCFIFISRHVELNLLQTFFDLR